MALPTSGLLKWSDIQTEFGGTDPVKLSEYYGRDSVPGSGLIKASDFYGTSAVRYISGAAATANAVSANMTHVSGLNGNANEGANSRSYGLTVEFSYGQNVRYGQSGHRVTLSNLYNIAGISSADAGKAIAIRYEQLQVFRSTNGSDDTGIVTDSCGNIGVSYAANGTTVNTTTGWVTAGSISSTSNGSCSFIVNHATNQSTSQYSGESAKDMTIRHNLYSNSTSQAIRIT